MNIDELQRAFFNNLYEVRIPIAIGSVAAAVLFLLVARRFRWFDAARRHPGRAGALLVVALAVGLPIGWYVASPLFVRSELVEPDPIAAALPSAGPSAIQVSPQASAAQTSPRPLGSAVPASAIPTSSSFVAHARQSGEFRGTDDFHFGKGTASIVETAPGTYVLRLADFSVRNGPDLYVYLSPDASQYVDGSLELGKLKATDGAFSYELPAGTDPTGFKSALIWCKQFSHLFAVAPLDAV